MSSASENSGNSSINSITIHEQFAHLLGSLSTLRDEVEMARVLHRPDEPPMRAPQIQLLDHFTSHRPHLFQKKLRVSPEIFDNILNEISDDPIFHNQSNNPQLPVAIQLAIFLNRAGHYGNTISSEDVCQWAGVSVGSVTNYTNHVMIALLAKHDKFIFFPTLDSDDAGHSRKYVQDRTCPEWRNGTLTADGSLINLCDKPGLYGETFYSRKSQYFLNYQAIIMIHNLARVDYAIGHTGSAHEAYAFRSTHIYHHHATLLGDHHWIWADSAYSLEPWCIPPFKKPVNGALTSDQKAFNTALSTVCVLFYFS
ncbi:hypothetical protein P692DRAFT_20747942 [Suillus brevipes Sb2]|nr:hypothetical protein P692DRAFT_20747942 [Suillus brevipes Sb2]